LAQGRASEGLRRDAMESTSSQEGSSAASDARAQWHEQVARPGPKVTALLAALEDGEPRTPLGVRRLANAKRHWTLTTELRSDVSTDA